jgi:hypothetical protein
LCVTHLKWTGCCCNISWLVKGDSQSPLRYILRPQSWKVLSGVHCGHLLWLMCTSSSVLTWTVRLYGGYGVPYKANESNLCIYSMCIS